MTMQFKQETVDPLDLDEYIDFSQGTFSPSSVSTASSRAKTLQTPGLNAPRPTKPIPQMNPNTFAGPSHQYDLHKQTTGFPMGAVANTIATVRQMPFSMSALNSGFGGPRNSEDVFNFNAIPANSFGNMGDMDMDFDSPVDGFVDPNAVGGSSAEPAAPTPPVKFWPGMHTQQAALAKQQQQEEIMRQQQQKAMQQQQPRQTETSGQTQHKRNNSRSNPAGKSTDPVVEERISRLLNQMRNSSVSSNEGGQDGSQSHSHRSRKDEEDMDDDERLLASEEGKKLSSKERRQLRNKVSARAFRSRRKEYISQLEGEISGKAKENDDLLAENSALKAENQRLTDLSKMLLASPAFSHFLSDLSANGMPALMENMSAQQQQQAQPQEQPQQQPTHTQQPKNQQFKDTSSTQQQQQFMQQQQQGSQMGMGALQEEVDFSNLDTNGNWGVGMDFGFDATVFAVTELPQGPAVDQEVLSGKHSSHGTSFETEPAKKNIPVIEAIELPVVSSPSKPATTPFVDESVDFDESHPAYALFAEASSASTSEKDAQLFGSIPFEKAIARFEIIVQDSEAARDADAAAERRFSNICARLDDIVADIQ